MIWLNKQLLNFNTFPNGETLADGNEIIKGCGKKEAKYNLITLKYENDSDLIKLMFVKKYIDELEEKSYLQILYMPYSRMDRKENESVFTLKYVSEFINSLKFKKVMICEPHSDVTPALINNCEYNFSVVNITRQILSEINFNKDKDYIYFPDAGAEKRYSKFFGDYKQLTGIKHRDFTTGHIKSLQVVGEVEETNFKTIIVDDLCSKGGTFILSAKKLKKMGASEIYLVVTHCENSIYQGEIPNSDLITKVFTTGTILNEGNEKIIIKGEIF